MIRKSLLRTEVSTPYRENAIVSIARAAEASGKLQRFYTTLYLGGWARIAQRLPLIGQRLFKELSRRTFTGIPNSRVATAATISEMRHSVARRLFGRRHPDWVANLMYRVKAQFDTAVSNKLAQLDRNVFIGMYAASCDSFSAVHRHGGLAVLNFVNSHPVEHNRYLIELGGLKTPHHELIPKWVAQRVEAELKLADLVLVPSRFIADQLLAHGVEPEKITTIPYGVDLSAFYPLREPAPEKDHVECLYVGQISHRKGIRLLLESARCLQDLPVKFRLMGPIVSAEVLDGLPENMIYEGPNLPGGVAEAMRRTDLFVLPTLEDACALVVLEAMASGLPVITTMNNGSGELIDTGHDGLIVPAGNKEALAGAIRALVGSSSRRRKMGSAARQKVQDAHSWEAYGQRVLDTISARYQELGLYGVSRG